MASIYEDVRRAVELVALKRGISLVLRFSNERVDPSKPDDVGAALNRSVVVCESRLDITREVSERLNRR
jgi:Skp family chaperone for outer membrane proteins